MACFEYLTTVVVEVFRVRRLDCRVKVERVPQLPGREVLAIGQSRLIHASPNYISPSKPRLPPTKGRMRRTAPPVLYG